MIKRIAVENFRTLRDVKLDLGLRNVLVGPNMSGKSNLIDLFRFIWNMVVTVPGISGLGNAFNLRNGFYEVAWKGSDSPLIKIELSASSKLDGMEAEWKYLLSILGAPQSGWARIQDESLSLRLAGKSYELIGKQNGQRVLLNRDGKTLSQLHDPDRSALEFEIPDWEGNLVRRSILTWHFYSLIPALMRQANPTASANFLTERGDNLSAWLLTLQTRFQDEYAQLRNVVKDVFPGLEDLFTNPTQQSTVFLTSREKYLRRPVPAWQMSDGELAFIGLLSLILAPRELGSDLTCVEEPESHLHPKLLRALWDLLCQAQMELGSENSGQLILSTHSPQLVDACSLDEIVVVERREGMTTCSRPADKKHLRDLLEREEVGLGSLFYSGALSSAE